MTWDPGPLENVGTSRKKREKTIRCIFSGLDFPMHENSPSGQKKIMRLVAKWTSNMTCIVNLVPENVSGPHLRVSEDLPSMCALRDPHEKRGGISASP